jgi:hypothetical protein
MHTLLDLAQKGLTGSKAAQTDKFTFDAKKYPSAAPPAGSSSGTASKAPAAGGGNNKNLLVSVLPGNIPPNEMAAKINREFEAKANISNS